MGSTVSLDFTKEEPEKLNSAIAIVREFLEYLPNSKVKFDSSGEHPSITIERIVRSLMQLVVVLLLKQRILMT